MLGLIRNPCIIAAVLLCGLACQVAITLVSGDTILLSAHIAAFVYFIGYELIYHNFKQVNGWHGSTTSSPIAFDYLSTTVTVNNTTAFTWTKAEVNHCTRTAKITVCPTSDTNTSDLIKQATSKSPPSPTQALASQGQLTFLLTVTTMSASQDIPSLGSRQDDTDNNDPGYAAITDKKNQGLIIGWIVGILGTVCIIAFVVWWFAHRQRHGVYRRRQQNFEMH